VPNPPGTTIPRAQVQPEESPQPVAVAAASAPQAVPLPEQPPRQVAKAVAAPLRLRGTNTEFAARPRMTTAEPREVAKALARSRGRAAEPAAAPANNSDIRTAYSAPAPKPAASGSVIAGAQPTLPVGSFDSRWSAMR